MSIKQEYVTIYHGCKSNELLNQMFTFGIHVCMYKQTERRTVGHKPYIYINFIMILLKVTFSMRRHELCVKHASLKAALTESLNLSGMD